MKRKADVVKMTNSCEENVTFKKNLYLDLIIFISSFLSISLHLSNLSLDKTNFFQHQFSNDLTPWVQSKQI